jgi:hypothetical protein
MAYSNFKLKEIERLATLKEELKPLFPTIQPIQPSAWLKETLSKASHLVPKTEKARSELIIMPILLELLDINQYTFTIFSGESLDVDSSLGLNGECDFILSKGESYSIQTPIFALVEAKQNIIENSLGQCVAQMVGSEIYNQAEGHTIPFIYGCVTNGSEWQFLKLENKVLSIDNTIYYFNQIETILGILQEIIYQSVH